MYIIRCTKQIEKHWFFFNLLHKVSQNKLTFTPLRTFPIYFHVKLFKSHIDPLLNNWVGVDLLLMYITVLPYLYQSF